MTIRTIGKALSKRYVVHLIFAFVVLFALVIDVPVDDGLAKAFSFFASEFLNVVSLVVFCIGSFEVLKRFNLNIWVTHGLTILVANFLTVLLDFNLDLFVFEYGQMMQSALPRPDQFTGGVFWSEYMSDFKYALSYWGFSEVASRFFGRHQSNLVKETQAKTSVNITGFLKQVPVEWRRNIDILEAQENYVKLYSGNGTKTVLYKFKDAVSEMGDIVGLQVHRSYWVRRDAIAQFKKTDGRGEIVTLSGRIIPVSRTYLKIVQDIIEANES